MRIWARTFKDNRTTNEITIEDLSAETRTHKIFNAIDKIAYDFDISRPIWLESNISDFKRHAKVKFRQDSFIEEIPFDYLEVCILDED